MKVEITEPKGILVVPETDFETEYLRSINIENTEVFHKCGVTFADYIGLKIKQLEKEEK